MCLHLRERGFQSPVSQNHSRMEMAPSLLPQLYNISLDMQGECLGRPGRIKYSFTIVKSIGRKLRHMEVGNFCKEDKGTQVRRMELYPEVLTWRGNLFLYVLPKAKAVTEHGKS